MQQKLVSACPQCGSTEVRQDTSDPLQGPFGLPERFVCGRCGYTGYTFPEVPEEDLAEFQHHARHHHKTERRVTTPPEALPLWKVFAPACLVLGILLLTFSVTVAVVLLVLAVLGFYFAYFHSGSHKRAVRHAFK